MERINKTLVSCLRTFTEPHQHWDSRLLELEFAINTAQQESMWFALCQLVFGRMLQFSRKIDQAKVDELILLNDDDLKDYASNQANRLAKASSLSGRTWTRLPPNRRSITTSTMAIILTGLEIWFFEIPTCCRILRRSSTLNWLLRGKDHLRSLR